MFALLAQRVFVGWGLGEIVIALIVICGILGIGFIVLRQSGIPVPPWIWSIAWIVILCFVAIFAIRLLLAM